MITYYLSGPMRGYEDYNHPAFRSAEDALSRWIRTEVDAGRWPLLADEGFKIINPARNFNGDTSLSLDKYMRKDLSQVVKSDVIVLLPLWEESEGANLELKVAQACGLDIMRAAGNTEDGWRFHPFEPVAGGVRTFASGATRDTEQGKYDFEAFLSPIVLEAFAAYMHKHRERNDGTLRDGDDWQKGIPYDVYAKSMWRHFMQVWKYHRGYDCDVIDPVESLMALMFNVQGYAYELLRN